MLSLLIGLALVAYGHGDTSNLERRVTLELRGAPLPYALSEISRLSGVKLSAEGAIRTEIVALRLDKAPIKETMQRMADALLSNWKENDGRYTLVRSRRKVRAWNAGSTKKLAKRFVAEAAKRAAFKPLSLDDARTMVRYRSHQIGPFVNGYTTGDESDACPLMRAMGTFNAALPVERIAAMLPGKRLILSNRPTRGQLPLGEPAKKWLERFYSEQAVLTQALDEKRGDPNWGTEWGERYRHDILSSDIWAKAQRGKDMVAVVTRTPFKWEVELYLGSLASPAELGTTRSAYADADERDALTHVPDVEGEHEPSLIGHVAMTRPDEWYESPPLSSKITRQSMLNMECEDPLGWVCGDVLLQWSRRANRNLVAVLPDVAFIPWYRDVIREWSKVHEMADQLINRCGLSFADDGRWAVIQPELTPERANDRCPRELLKRYAEIVPKDREAALREFARVVAATPRSLPAVDIANTFLLADRVELGMDGREDTALDILRVIGSLPPSIAVPKGQGSVEFTVGELPRAARKVVSDCIYLSSHGLLLGNEGGYVGEHGPTWLYPNGLPDDAVVTLSVYRNANLLGTAGRRLGYWMEFGSPEHAGAEAAWSNPSATSAIAEVSKECGLVAAVTGGRIEMRISVGHYHWDGLLYWETRGSEVEFTDPSELPDWVQRAMEASFDAQRATGHSILNSQPKKR